jgi:alpha-galactosidase
MQRAVKTAGLKRVLTTSAIATVWMMGAALAEEPLKTEEAMRKNQWMQEHVMEAKAKPPFSFVYDGKASDALLAGWSGKTASKKLDANRTQHTLTWVDPKTALEVRCVAVDYADYPAVEWTVYFTNRGEKDSPMLEQVMGVDVAVAPQSVSRVVLHRLNGAPSRVDDWMPFDQPVAPGKRIDFAATAGRSSNVSPWFNVDWGNGGTITAIGWSGQWCASVEFKDGQIRTRAGMQNLRTVLHPGESVRSARILQLHWQGGDPFRGYNLFRQMMLAHIMPRIGGQLVVPPIVHLSTSFYELNHSNEENVLSHLQSIKGLGFEMFWLDAYWTGPNGFPNSMGNYGFPIERVEPKDRFPNGLKAIGDAVEAEGLGFVLWFEPERVPPGTMIAKEHPEWVINSLFNLGIPEARRFMTDYLNAAIKAYKVSCLRIDYNIDPLGPWQAMDAKDPSRTGMTEMRYVEGLYQMWDDILRANPKLFIDNCAAGGRRIDLETMSRSIPLWRSDNTCDMLDKQAKTIARAAIKNQLMSGGLNRYVPFSTVGQMGATPYLFRSGFNAGIAFAEDVRPKDYPRDLLKQGIAEGKRIRKYFFGNFYPLVESGQYAGGWCVLQYHRPAQGDGMVMAFRREEAPDNTRVCELREIDPAASYRVTIYRAYEPEAPLVMKGTDLQKLTITIADRPGSVIVEYATLVTGPATRGVERR